MATEPLLKSIHFTVVVFGERYTRLFTEICFPNLVALLHEVPPDLLAGSKLRIYTTPEDMAAIRDCRPYSHALQLLPAEILDRVRKDRPREQGDYSPMCLAQAEAVVEASAVGGALIFFPADSIFAK